MEIAIMLEGQNGMNWSNWQRFARAVEDLGFAGLYRSDHFTNAEPPNQDSLELWVALTWLASHTQRIEFGPLVSPVSFRHPAMQVRMASAVDDLSGGRLTFGVGAGWQDREHQMYSFDLLSMDERFARFEEAVQIMHRLLKQADPVTFEGKYYHFHEAVLLPRPQRPGGPPILIGGKGRKRTLPLVARYADEWNGVFMTPAHYGELNTQLDTLLRQHNRPPGSVRRSLMTGLVFGRDDAEARRRLGLYGASDPAELLPHGAIFGTTSAVQDQLGAFAEAGVQRIMLQWLDLNDVDGLEALAQAVL
jgi:F420-dependent oxidoreductase-like protein